MKISRFVAAVIVSVIVGVPMLTMAAPSGAATCTDPGTATDYKNPDGTINIQAYLAAVAAFNACVAGENVSTNPPAAAPAASGLAFTGSESRELAVLGIAIVGVGAVAVVVARRRRADAGRGGDSG
jgi:hypothetical protein